VFVLSVWPLWQLVASGGVRWSWLGCSWRRWQRGIAEVSWPAHWSEGCLLGIRRIWRRWQRGTAEVSGPARLSAGFPFWALVASEHTVFCSNLPTPSMRVASLIGCVSYAWSSGLALGCRLVGGDGGGGQPRACLCKVVMCVDGRAGQRWLCGDSWYLLRAPCSLLPCTPHRLA
jgi:hypothetical protein